MIELFKDIITGEKSISMLDQNILPGNMRNKKLTAVAKLFLKAARGKYSIGEIDKEDLSLLFDEYDKLIRTDDKIKNYIESSFDDEISLGLINHIIVIFMDNFVKNKETLKSPKTNVIRLKRNISVSGYVEPLLLGVVSAGIGLLFLANLYLGI